MMLFVVYYLQDGIVGFVRKSADASAAAATVDCRQPTAPAAMRWRCRSGGAARAARKTSCNVRGVLMQFGGLKALNNVDLNVRRGTIHGLIGPNGSGKSTMMNVLTGIYVPTAGTIDFDGASLAGAPPSEIALSGIARTFQNVQLFGEMTALRERAGRPASHVQRAISPTSALMTPRYRREERAARERAFGMLRFVGLDDVAAEEARNLPYGKQRLLEIARALALDPQLLLLDEPAAGLTAPDIKELIAIIRKIRDHGITVDPDRAPHGRGDERLRHGLGARLRAEDRRRQAGRGAGQREGHRSLSRRPAAGRAA